MRGRHTAAGRGCAQCIAAPACIASIELLCSGERQLQVAEDARMAATDFKACDLGGADIKGVRPSPERTGAAA